MGKDINESERFTQDTNRNPIVKNKREDPKRQNKWLKIALLIFCILLLLLIVALLILLFVYYFNESDSSADQVKDPTVCDTKECIETAKYLQSSLDLTVDPCEDFFNYSCRGWILNNPKPHADENYGVSDAAGEQLKKDLIAILEDKNKKQPIAIKKAQNFFKACTDLENRDEYGIAELKRLLTKIGGFPMISKHWDENKYDWEQAYVHADTRLKIQPFFSYKLKDSDDGTSKTINIASPTSLPFGYSLVNTDNTVEELMKEELELREQVRKRVKILGSDVDDEEIDTDITHIIELDKTLANFSYIADEVQEYDDYDEMTFAEMVTQYKGVHWFKIFRDIFAEVKIKISKEEDKANVYNRYYFNKLGPILHNTPLRTIANYIGWRVIKDFGTETIAKFKYEDEDGKVDEKTLKSDCYDATEKFFRTAVNQLFVHQYYSNSSLNELNEFLYQLRTALTLNLQTNKWMDDNTKLKAQLKLNKMIAFIATPSDIKNDDDLNRLYEETGIISEENYVNAYKKMLKWKKDYKNSQLRTTLKKITVEDPSTVNAFYDASENKIAIATGILRPPFYYPDAPLAVNYGGIGSVIGHEITHGYDDEGSQYNYKGEEKNWWSKEAKRLYKNKVDCYIKQYSEFVEPTTGLHINGSQTIGDNIADNGGLKQAYLAFKLHTALKNPEKNLKLPLGMSQFTQDQLFFISFANSWCVNPSKDGMEILIEDDEHSPDQARVIVTLQNTKEFAEAFKCPVGSKMNPEKRCLLW